MGSGTLGPAIGTVELDGRRRVGSLPGPIVTRLDPEAAALIQVATLPRFMVRPPERFAIALARAPSIRHLFLLIFAKRAVRTDRVQQAQNKRANNGRLQIPCFSKKNSLIRVCKFPVLLRREFAWKPLNSLADWTSKSQRRVGFSKIPC